MAAKLPARFDFEKSLQQFHRSIKKKLPKQPESINNQIREYLVEFGQRTDVRGSSVEARKKLRKLYRQFAQAVAQAITKDLKTDEEKSEDITENDAVFEEIANIVVNEILGSEIEIDDPVRISELLSAIAPLNRNINMALFNEFLEVPVKPEEPEEIKEPEEVKEPEEKVTETIAEEVKAPAPVLTVGGIKGGDPGFPRGKPFKFPDFSKKAEQRINAEINKRVSPGQSPDAIAKAVGKTLKGRARITIPAIVAAVTSAIALASAAASESTETATSEDQEPAQGFIDLELGLQQTPEGKDFKFSDSDDPNDLLNDIKRLKKLMLGSAAVQSLVLEFFSKPKHYPGYNYLGPFTPLYEQVKNPNLENIPIDKLDMLALEHDFKYQFDSKKIRQAADAEMIGQMRELFKEGSNNALKTAWILMNLKSQIEATGLRIPELTGGDEKPSELAQRLGDASVNEYKNYLKNSSVSYGKFPEGVRKPALGLKPPQYKYIPAFEKQESLTSADVVASLPPQAEPRRERTSESTEVTFDFDDISNISKKFPFDSISSAKMAIPKKEKRTQILKELDAGARKFNNSTIDSLWNLGITQSEIKDLFSQYNILKPPGFEKMKKTTKWDHLIKNVTEPTKTDAEAPTSAESAKVKPTPEPTEAPTSAESAKVKPTPEATESTGLEGAIRDLINVISVSSTPIKDGSSVLTGAATTTETDISSFDALGYSVTNSDSKTATDAITPSAEEQKVSDYRFSVEGLVTSNLWRDVDSSMNEDLVLRHKIEFGGDLYSGDLSGNFSKKPRLGKRFDQKLRPELYNRDFMIPKYQDSQPNSLTIVLDQISPPQDNFFDNLRNNPERAPWRDLTTARTPLTPSA